ncbi:MAG: hypothetical protein QXF12_01955 [Candidatus Aenigmatarchaeota archaeon]
MSKNYFFLKTKKKLSSDEIEFLKYVLENHKGNEDLTLPVFFKKNNKIKRTKIFLIKKENNFYYCIPLIKKLSDEDVEEIDKKLNLKFNFHYKILHKKKREEDKDNSHFYENLSKLIYNEILRKRIEDGWRYGFTKDKKNKISPEIVEWERLSKPRKEEFIKFCKIIYDVIKTLEKTASLSKSS